MTNPLLSLRDKVEALSFLDTNDRVSFFIRVGSKALYIHMLIKLANALEVEMWEMFDFGHVKSYKDLKESLQSIIKTADEPTLRLALKIIRTVIR
jgi:hypothetical protein